MLFNTLTYLIFITLVFCIHWSVKNKQAQNGVIVLASMVFYGWWSVPCLGLMVGTCVLNYLLVKAMQWHKPQTKRKPWMVFALLMNFGILGVFKYFNFFADNLAVLLHSLNMNADLPTLNIILPVGISFYTFQLSAYVIDCYRKELYPALSFMQFMAFICFFPQLVAGPIERGRNLLPQFGKKRTFNEATATEGMRLILWGLVKKMLIADNCEAQVDFVFSNYETVSASTLWLGALYFTFQIYGDFSGYCDMAIGSAKLFGIQLTQNFNRPYFATSMQDFWRRWHITLMGWFKDYVYIPLGGNRKGDLRKRINNLIVFTLSGLWHGSNWTFVCWGLYHALVYYLPVKRLAFLLVVIGWVIFRAPDMEVAAGFLAGMFQPITLITTPACSRMPLLLIVLLMVVEWRMKDHQHPFLWKNYGWQSSQMVRMVVYWLIFFTTVLFGGEQIQFIYFQF